MCDFIVMSLAVHNGIKCWTDATIIYSGQWGGRWGSQWGDQCNAILCNTVATPWWRHWTETQETIASLSTVPRWIRDWFKKADKNNDGRMNFKEVRDLLRMMNVDMNEHHAHRLFTVRSFFSLQRTCGFHSHVLIFLSFAFASDGG